MLHDNGVEEKIFFLPGDVVELRLDIQNKPRMIVRRVERSIMKNKLGKEPLKGVRCGWFTTTGSFEEAIFSTKDLVLL